MKIGVISDVHGNSTALQTVLDDMPPVDKLVSLGDVIGYGPSPDECVELIQEHADVSLYGNHEMFLEKPEKCKGNTGAYAGIQLAREKLTPNQFDWARNRPWRETIESLGTAHGHPNPNTPFRYVRKSNVTDLIPFMRDAPFEMLAVGHSHVQFEQDLQKFDGGTWTIFNPGSVGQPRDGDPRAAYGVVDTTQLTVDLHRVEYDIDRVVDAMKTANLPDESWQRLKHGKHPDHMWRL